MGELIRRERAGAPLGFTGERLTAAISGQIEIEHYHRYLLAREFCRDRDVLDVAAGEGYGTALLAQVARSAVGVEIDAEAAAAARAEFDRPNLAYVRGDARKLPLRTDSIDVAVSFETLEHLTEQELFLAELRRVLRPDGLLIISTPDRDAYSPIGAPPNPFHQLELTRDEFDALLQRYFSRTVLAAQRALIGSVILFTGENGAVRAYERRSESVIEGSEHLPRAPYLIAFASNASVPLLSSSVYVYRSDLDTDPTVRREAELRSRAAEQLASELQVRVEAAGASAAEAQARAEEAQAHVERAVAEMRAHSARLEEANRRIVAAEQDCSSLNERASQLASELEDARRRSAAAEQSLAESEARAAHAESDVTQISRRLQSIETSSTWRATRPLRHAAERFPSLARNMRRGVQLLWWAGTLQLSRRYRLWREHRQARQQPPAQLEHVSEQPLQLPEAHEIRIPASDQPLVSLLIPTFGQASVTLRCLRSIADHAPLSAIEVIVIDDAYAGPEDIGALRQVAGVQLIRNGSNLGFLRSCNRAAALAKGRYIYLLNNDTELQPGTIDSLAETLDARPDVGIVGSKLLHPDGRLQEAGGIIWSDASGWNYGRDDDPSRPEYNYVREVDYCSGASIMVRRELWEQLGGFDEAFAPAYYEDTDLCFRARAQGFKVLYEPRSIVVHHEGISHGTDLASGVKAHQVANQRLMAERWGETLGREHFPNGECVLRARDRARGRNVVLVIDHYVPEPDRDAGSRSTMGILDSLLEAGWVVKFFPQNRAYSPVYTMPLERRGIEVLDHRFPGTLADWLDQNGEELDHVIVLRPHVATEVLPHIVTRTHAMLSFEGVDLHFARLRRQAVATNDAELHRQAAEMERLERRVWRHFDLVLYLSDEEAEAVRAMSPRTVARSVVGFCCDPADPAADPGERQGILFVAGFAHPPNVDAAVFLVREVMPLVWQDIGPVKLVLAGSSPTEEVRALAGPLVEVTGYVTDARLAELYAQHRVSIVPLRFGAGVKGKVVEALAQGLPLVTTSVGAQGIQGLDRAVAMRDDVTGIVAALEQLLTDDAAWIAQSAAQIELARRLFSRHAMRDSILSALRAGEEAIGRIQ